MGLDTAETNVSVSQTDSGYTVALRGTFHLEYARQLHQAALQAAETGGAVTVDCSTVEHLDGSAAQILLALKLLLARNGGSLRMTGLNEEVRRYLAWAGLEEQFGTGSPAAPRKRKRSSRKRAS